MRLALLAAAGLLFATSASALTPYQPANPSRSPYGYAETQIEYNRVRVTFAGDSSTNRETVETYLLFRAAETTLARGYDHFVVLDHNVEESSEFRTSGPPRPPIAPRNYREVSRYQAMSDIVMQRGPRPDGQANAYDARAVMANLAWRIQRPR
jgi:hypothetical protein